MKKRKEGRINDDAKADYKPFKLANIYTNEQLKKEYQKEGKNFNDEEIIKIRKGFDFLHEINYLIWTQQNLKREQEIKEQNLTITVNNNNIKNEKSNIIYPSEYRRAS